jgi:RNA chaperone Hfq
VETTQETIMVDTIKTESEFFAARIADGRQVHVFLINGIKLQARISAVDEHCIFLQGGADTRFASTSLIMKSAVSSVIPVPDSESRRTDARDLQDVLSINRKC